MRIAYLDCASGISGDMTLGALVDAGVPLEAIGAGVASLGLPNCQLEAETVKRKGFRATKVHVRHEPEHAHRHLHHITDMIDASSLTSRQRDFATRIFTRLAEAEAHVHGTTIRKVHFHEVGAVDSIADIVGSAIGWDLLGVDKIYCSPIPTGNGFIEIAHGRTSLPAPATAELLKGIPLAASKVDAELTTPTGAAIVSALATGFGKLPPMTIDRIGYGAGDRDFSTHPNILRLIVGTATNEALTNFAQEEDIVVLETNLDSVSGEVVGQTSEQLMAAGALDVFATAIQMKKNRPGTMITVLCRSTDRSSMESILFRETNTLGIRHTATHRTVLARERHHIETKFGLVDGNRVTDPEGHIRFSPEFETCRKLAMEHHVPVRDVLLAAQCQYELSTK